MFLDLVESPTLSKARYDRLLSQGYFRSGGMLFRTDLICVEGEVWTPVNIRLDLKDFATSKSQRKLLRRVRKRFQVRIHPFVWDEEREALYQAFKGHFKGFIHADLESFLLEGNPQLATDTREVAVYDGSRLVGFSLFDCASSSLASLLAVYHADYARWSLGRFSLIEEALWAQENGLRWVYPGYVLDQPSLFDYKLLLGPMRHRNARGRWLNMAAFNSQDTIAHEVREASNRLAHALKLRMLPVERHMYPYFSLAFVHEPSSFLDLPIYFELGGEPGRPWVAGFHPVELRFVLAEVEDLAYPIEDELLKERWRELAMGPTMYMYGARMLRFSDADALADHAWKALRSWDTPSTSSPYY